MAAVLMRIRGEFSSRWRGWLSLALVLGFSGGVVLACLAGARRTDSAYGRFLVASDAVDAVLFGPPGALDFEAIRRLPQVADSGTVNYVALYAERDLSRTRTRPTRETTVAWFASPDGIFTRLNRPSLVSGRRPRALDEVAVTPTVAEAYGLEIGDTWTVRAARPDEVGEVLGTTGVTPEGPSLTLRVVGTVVAAGELQPLSEVGTAHLTPEFVAAYRDRVAMVPGIYVKLRNGDSDLAAFQRGVEDLAGARPSEILSSSHETRLVQRGVHIEAQALRLFALLAGIASAFIAYQTLTRLIYSESDDYHPLTAMGFTRFQLWAFAMGRTSLIGTFTAAFAVVVAVALSAGFPLGKARLVEPSPGIRVDAAIVGTGALLILIMALALSAAPAWRVFNVGSVNSETPPEAGRAGRLRKFLIRLSASPAALTGVTLATESGKRRRAVPIRSAVAGCSVALAALVLAFTLGSSLDRLLSSPHLYGWGWDAVFGNQYGGDISAQAAALHRTREVESFSTVGFAQMEIGGSRITALAFGLEQGHVLPPIVQGRAPQADDEIVVGKKVAGGRARLGDPITLRAGTRRVRMQVVGFAVFPSLGSGEISGLGEGALLTDAGIRRVVPEFERNLVALRFAGGVDDRVGILAVRNALGGANLTATLETPLEVAYFEEVERVPLILAGLLAIVAAATLAHTLVTTVRRRRREVAILKTLGFVRGQVLSTISWQASTMIGLALTVGIPIGLVAGRTVWRAFADNLGIVPEPVSPWIALALIVPAALGAANLIAAFPARAAADTEPAVTLRSL